jgi:hypothetical protein
VNSTCSTGPVISETDISTPRVNELTPAPSNEDLLTLRSESSASDRTTNSVEKRHSIFTPLQIRDKLAKSARLDRLIKKDAVKREQQLHVLVLGHNRSSLVRNLRINFGEQFTSDEVKDLREVILTRTTFALLSVVQYVEDTRGSFTGVKSSGHLKILRDFATLPTADYVVTDEVAIAAASVWNNWFVQQAFQNMNQDCTTA